MNLFAASPNQYPKVPTNLPCARLTESSHKRDQLVSKNNNNNNNKKTFTKMLRWRSYRSLHPIHRAQRNDQFNNTITQPAQPDYEATQECFEVKIYCESKHDTRKAAKIWKKCAFDCAPANRMINRQKMVGKIWGSDRVKEKKKTALLPGTTFSIRNYIVCAPHNLLLLFLLFMLLQRLTDIFVFILFIYK